MSSPENVEMLAINALFQSGTLGLGWADDNQIVKFKRGSFANSLSLNKPLCDHLVALAGMEQKISKLKSHDRATLTIPRVALIDRADSREKVSIEVIWDKNLSGYIVLFHSSDMQLQAEEALTRQLRVRRIAEENFHAGSDFFSTKSALAEEIIHLLAKNTESKGSNSNVLKDNPLDKLTKREKEVVKLLVNGKPNKLIAHALRISKKTVEAHRSRAIKRLGLKSTAELIRLAVESGWQYPADM